MPFFSGRITILIICTIIVLIIIIIIMLVKPISHLAHHGHLLIWPQHEDLLQQLKNGFETNGSNGLEVKIYISSEYLSRSRNIDKGVDVDVGKGGHQELAVESGGGGGHSFGFEETQTCP